VGAVAKFAAGGKNAPKKDLGLMAMAYGTSTWPGRHGRQPQQTLKAIQEAEAYDGPSLIIAYSHCIATASTWPWVWSSRRRRSSAVTGRYRYDPRLRGEGKNPFQLDSKPPKIAFRDYAMNETRYRMLAQSDPKTADMLMAEADVAIQAKWKELLYQAAEV
jgi:pyruvate-ferredoxin/flavodoxin oxidoreductase